MSYEHTTFTVAVAATIGAITLALFAGVYIGRSEVRATLNNVADEAVAQGPANSFTMCLTKAWEDSGELDPKWKGQKRWQLVTP